MRHKPFGVIALSFLAATSLSAREPKPEETWPGFRGHEMSGVAATAKIPDRWSTREHVKWAVPIAGHGWSSPIVWGDTVFVTSAISSREYPDGVEALQDRKLTRRLMVI
jgi:outer membrane protein assembly factor BamB